MFKPPSFFALGLVTLLLSGCKKEAPPAPPPPKVTVSKPIQQEITEWDEYTGRLAATEEVEIRAQVSGYLDSIHFKDGQIVKKGDLLFVIDPRPYQAAFDRADAQAKQAEAALSLADANLKRTEQLRKTNAIAAEEADTKRGAQLEAVASSQAAQAAVKAAKLNIDFTQIAAPIGGRIGRHLVSEGNLITGGASNATLLTTIVALDPIHAYFEADESAFLKYLRLDQSGQRKSSRDTPNPVQIALADEKGFPHVGRMDFVENRIDAGTSTIQGRAIFDNKDLALLPGLFVRLRLIGSGKYNALLIPDAAISSDQAQKFVFVVNAQNKVEYHAVTPGPMIDGLRVIREGIKAGDRVIVDGLQSARPDAVVDVEEKPLVSAAKSDDLAGVAPAFEKKTTVEPAKEK